MQIQFSTQNTDHSAICIGTGLSDNLKDQASIFFRYKKVLVVTDQYISDLYKRHIEKQLEHMGLKTNFLVMSSDEKERNMTTATKIIETMTDFNLNVNDALICLGGSTLSDLCRFCSAMYLGGIDLVLIPTTLASQVDNAIGSDYTINTNRAKNILSLPKLPKIVIIDPSFLKTLPQESISQGMVSVIRYACILDRPLFERMERMDKQAILENLEALIMKCINDRIKILKKDCYGRCLRETLAFGSSMGAFLHTSTLNDKLQFSKARAYGIGIYLSSLKSDRLNELKSGTKLAERVKNLLEKYGLEISLPTITRADIEHWLETDKYIFRDKVNVVLLNDIGETYIREVNKRDFVNFWLN